VKPRVVAGLYWAGRYRFLEAHDGERLRARPPEGAIAAFYRTASMFGSVLRERVYLSEFSLNPCDLRGTKIAFAGTALARHSGPAILAGYYCNGSEETDLSQLFRDNPPKLGIRNSSLSHKQPRNA
jgi:hypothetical protein